MQLSLETELKFDTKKHDEYFKEIEEECKSVRNRIDNLLNEKMVLFC